MVLDPHPSSSFPPSTSTPSPPPPTPPYPVSRFNHQEHNNLRDSSPLSSCSSSRSGSHSRRDSVSSIKEDADGKYIYPPSACSTYIVLIRLLILSPLSPLRNRSVFRR